MLPSVGSFREDVSGSTPVTGSGRFSNPEGTSAPMRKPVAGWGYWLKTVPVVAALVTLIIWGLTRLF
jgi:hypothetical protein